MSERFLTILEVSQKQAYIFASNRLYDNVVNSAVIAWVMSEEYFEQKVQDKSVFDKEKNLVYSGGGHTILEFTSEEQAHTATKRITKAIRQEYPGIEVFAATIPYEEYEEGTPGKNVKKLIKTLEEKKALRRSAFHQGSFGIERIDSSTLSPVLYTGAKGGEEKKELPPSEKAVEDALAPIAYENSNKLENLGGSKGQSNFIAVVHIDGNAMGKRVEKLYETYKNVDWATYKSKLCEFSKSIDEGFKQAYKQMVTKVEKNLQEGTLKDLELKGKHFPIRRIITAGDDICFVTEGRIGIECAVELIKVLNQTKNAVDGECYSACAGVAIVHQKYPFYKAYELSEMLCSNAKRFGAGLKEDGSVSAIDWHIEFGEIKDTMEEVRSDYNTLDGKRLELRPYIIHADGEVLAKEPLRVYEGFKQTMLRLSCEEENYARGKMKELRRVLKEGAHATEYFLKFGKIQEITKLAGQEAGQAYVTTADGVERAVLFDAIELLDTYLELK